MRSVAAIAELLSLGRMSALAHISRAAFVVFALLAAFCFALPVFNALARSYEGGPMIFTCFFLGGFSAVVSGALYGCYRYARIERGSLAIRACIWCVVLVAVVAVSALAMRIIWLILHQTHAMA
jgi:hypothetical protein